MPREFEYKRLKNISEVAFEIKNRYFAHRVNSQVVLAIRQNRDKYLIFQQLNSFPFNIVIYNEDNKSLVFNADWRFPEKGFVLSGKELSEDEIDWDSIPLSNERRRPYFSIIQNFSGTSNIGSFGNGALNYANISIPLNRNLVPFRRQRNFNYNMEGNYLTRIENINRINLWDWGFEILSDTVNLVAYADNYDTSFPYQTKVASQERYEEQPEEQLRYLWTTLVNSTFSFSSIDEIYLERFIINRYSCFSPRNASAPQIPKAITHYWDSREDSRNISDDDFDEKIDLLAHGVKRKHMEIKDVGQLDNKDILL